LIRTGSVMRSSQKQDSKNSNSSVLQGICALGGRAA
jgi:hypothetical protein